MINVFQPSLGSEELAAVDLVFRSNWLGKGAKTAEFELAFATHLGVERETVRTISCCTEGLFQAMALLGIGQGDEVVLPSISFVGAANAVASSGAKPVFCDVDPRTLNVTADSVARRLTPRSKAVLLLHYGGVPGSVLDIAELLRHKKVALIEDSACSVASRADGRACGTLGDIGVWSFDAMKVLVTGDGGMIYRKDPDMSTRLERLTYLGLETTSGLASAAENKWWAFAISCYGRRAIVNDITSAIGIEQLRKLPAFVARRRAIHEHYDAAFADVGWIRRPPAIPESQTSTYYFYWIQVDSEARDRLAAYLRAREIYTTFRYYPLHLVEHYQAGCTLPGAEQAAAESLCIPIHQGMSEGDVEAVISAIRTFDSV